jgi:hypothetical protein
VRTYSSQSLAVIAESIPAAPKPPITNIPMKMLYIDESMQIMQYCNKASSIIYEY